MQSITKALNHPDTGIALLRVTSGVFFLIHGLIKVFIFTPAGTAGFFESIGLPGIFGYLTILAEVAGGVALIVGYQTRIVSAILAVVLLGALWFGHRAAGFTFSNPGGGWEYPLFWAVASVTLALTGPGAYAIDKKN